MNKNHDSAYKARQRMIARMYHKDASDDEDIDWITMENGEHVPLKNGKAIGGPMKGKDFSKAKSQKKSATSSTGGGNSGKKKSSSKKISQDIKTVSVDNVVSEARTMLKHISIKHFTRMFTEMKVGDEFVCTYKLYGEKNQYKYKKTSNDKFLANEYGENDLTIELTAEEAASRLWEDTCSNWDDEEGQYYTEDEDEIVVTDEHFEIQHKASDDVTGNDVDKKLPLGSKESADYESKKFQDNPYVTVNTDKMLEYFKQGTTEMASVTLHFINSSKVTIRQCDDKQECYMPAEKSINVSDSCGSRTLYHESWHAIDHMIFEVDKSKMVQDKDEYIEKLRKCNKRIDGNRYVKWGSCDTLSTGYILSTGKTFFETYLEEWDAVDCAELAKAYKYSGSHKKDAGTVSDMMSFYPYSFSCVLHHYHSSSYWLKNVYYGAYEAFANIAEDFAANSYGYEFTKKYFPKTVAAFEEIYSDIKSGKIIKK